MSVTATRTVREMCASGLRLAQIVAVGEEAAAVDVDEARTALDDMLKSWQPAEWMWTRATASLTLTTAQSYTLDPVRPLRILNARFKRSGIETPMFEMSAREWDELPQKAVTGQPTQFFYDRQREAALFYVWPQLATAAGETVEYRYERELPDVTDLNAVADIPGEWWRTVSYCLAADLAERYERPEPVIVRLVARAADAMQRSQAGAMTESVMFEPDFR